MSVQVRFFASLRELLQCTDAEVPAAAVRTVGDVWHQAVGERAPPGKLLMAVNQQYAGWDDPVADGDEVGFFPPVTGG
ncbi:MAG: MoaD/ThiS family protein [Pseudomonadota bacterium]|nr:MoaD/ThiS family protein [Pseudomonadota bacterium]HJO35741.1 MoaD/ThiS family protein [Gammaproteobacteria bacterium]